LKSQFRGVGLQVALFSIVAFCARMQRNVLGFPYQVRIVGEMKDAEYERMLGLVERPGNVIGELVGHIGALFSEASALGTILRRDSAQPWLLQVGTPSFGRSH
jgi:hypothetical protein